MLSSTSKMSSICTNPNDEYQSNRIRLALNDFRGFQLNQQYFKLDFYFETRNNTTTQQQQKSEVTKENERERERKNQSEMKWNKKKNELWSKVLTALKIWNPVPYVMKNHMLWTFLFRIRFIFGKAMNHFQGFRNTVNSNGIRDDKCQLVLNKATKRRGVTERIPRMKKEKKNANQHHQQQQHTLSDPYISMHYYVEAFL